ncbi:arabinosaccharide transport system substrate-binding protein [Caldalkalibacillus uzonensis]|uniref:Arabinosaccharide transport system substrate-binding protein n=1 Tax=Caldalkalibacillus uzonensis TaxID=353224 RepID=A0ABU0CQE6_9BACI|nr:ABC transporter substrate-binding protein [Caldalkalibacillus uzonensis]MDQ0338631.1 arabinosaccharide transport system substrate-binding protein [Caldalkalibacillus uzonensis]
MLKKYSLLFAILVMVLLLSACGGGGETTNEGDTEIIGSESDDAVELTFWTFQGLHIDFFEDAVLRWNEEYPDRQIRLIAQAYPYDNMHNNLLLALQSGTGAPDLADIEISRFSNYLQGDVQLLPLNDVLEPVIENFVQSRLDIYAANGNYYGMPTHVGATVMYYNMDIMNEAGIDPADIETWDDFVEAGKQVVERTGKPMLTVETGEIMGYWSMLTQRQTDFFDEEGNITVDSQDAIEVLQFLHDLVHVNNIAQLTPGGGHHAEEYYAFMNDEGAAAVLMPMWYMGRFLDYMPDLEGKMKIYPLPAWEPGGYRSAGMGGTGTVVTNQTEHPELAKEFLAFAKATSEGNIKLWQVLGFDPPRWDVWDSPELREDNKYYQYFGDNIFDVLLEIREEIYPVNITPNTPEVNSLITSNVLHNVLREQNQTPEEALTELANQFR